jgi:hypothetical protein
VSHRRGAGNGIRLPLLAGIIAVAASHGGAAAAVAGRERLHADAGLGGVARPGRWTPVRVEIDNAERDLTGEIVVEWGDARVHRAVDVPAPSRTVLELYVRTGDARGVISVRLVADGTAVESVNVPVRVVADEDALVLCAGNAPAAGDALPCTATVAPQALPRSMRGYAAADEVRLQPGAESQLTPAQRAALQQWRTYSELNAEGLLAQAPRAPLAAANATGAHLPTAFAATVAALALLCAGWIWTRVRAIHAYAAVAGAAALGMAAAVTAGRIGPGSAIRLRHATTVQQVSGGSIVTMRGVFEYPAAGEFAVRAVGFDGALVSRGAAEQWLDAEGHPVHRGTFGRGARAPVEMDGVADYAPFDVTTERDTVRIRNRSNATLTGCAFPEGFSATDAVSLAPGASVSARSVMPTVAPFFSCTGDEPPVTLADRRFPLHAEGTTVVSVRLPDAAPAAPAIE